MKAAILFALAMLCAGCGATDGALDALNKNIEKSNRMADVKKIDADERLGEQIDIRIDLENGCQYLAYRQNLTPRIAADGKSHQGCRGTP